MGHILPGLHEQHDSLHVVVVMPNRHACAGVLCAGSPTSRVCQRLLTSPTATSRSRCSGPTGTWCRHRSSPSGELSSQQHTLSVASETLALLQCHLHAVLLHSVKGASPGGLPGVVATHQPLCGSCLPVLAWSGSIRHAPCTRQDEVTGASFRAGCIMLAAGTSSSRAMQTPGCTCTPTASQQSGQTRLA